MNIIVFNDVQKFYTWNFLFCNSDLKRAMQFKFDWNIKTIYKNTCVNTTIFKSKLPWLDRQNITSISSKTHDLKETNALIQTLPCTVIMC